MPDLGKNIKCGNSLIGSDFYANRQGDLFDEDEMLRINAMLQRRIEAADKEIDRLVYKLYGLTEDEIKIVEGRFRNSDD